MILSRKCRNVHIIDCERTQEFLLISDLHWDNPKCDRELLKSHLEENPPEMVPQAGKMLHSTKVALVDGQGRVRGYYDGTGGELLGRALPDLGNVMREAGEGNRP